jgi:hypothetical protein
VRVIRAATPVPPVLQGGVELEIADPVIKFGQLRAVPHHAAHARTLTLKNQFYPKEMVGLMVYINCQIYFTFKQQ